jgi:NAD(P)H dehydrogenase (quinone)
MQPNLLNQLGLVEKALGALPTPVCFLRAAWFMENVAWDVAPARDLTNQQPLLTHPHA